MGVHALRIGMLVLLVVPLRIVGSQPLPTDGASGAPSLDRIQHALPSASRLGPPAAGGAWWDVLDADDQSLGMAAQTAPLSDRVVGYRGPSSVLLIADPQGRLVEAQLISSRDTDEHVRAVVESPSFFRQCGGLEIGESPMEVDAVSGATLTSLAILEAVSLRMSGERPSLKFPRPLDWHEGARWFPRATGGRPIDAQGTRVEMQDAAGQPLGHLVRTGPYVDTVVGYQGPSEILVGLGPRGKIIGAELRATFDDEPYTDYVREETYFWDRFAGKSPRELSVLDLREAGVEGVSGATMTSMAVAQTLVRWGEEYVARERQEAERARTAEWPFGIRWTWKDSLSVFFVVTAIVIGGTRLRGNRRVRVVWQIMVIAGFGILTGQLISQSLIFGWGTSGVAWRLAPTLAIVLGTMLLLPPITKRNIYCNHLCPHGAAQQLMRGRLPWKLTPGSKLTSVLAMVPGALLIAAYLLTLVAGDAKLAHWEPFDAYLWPVAALGSVILAIVSLAVSAVIPMAYCRFGCLTGRLLDYLRRTARSGRWQRADSVVLALAAFGWFWAITAT